MSWWEWLLVYLAATAFGLRWFHVNAYRDPKDDSPRDRMQRQRRTQAAVDDAISGDISAIDF